MDQMVQLVTSKLAVYHIIMEDSLGIKLKQIYYQTTEGIIIKDD